MVIEGGETMEGRERAWIDNLDCSVCFECARGQQIAFELSGHASDLTESRSKSLVERRTASAG